MPHITAKEIQELIDMVQSRISYNQFTLASTAFLVYDWALNLSSEVQEIWSTKVNAVMVLYVLTRYGIIISLITSCITRFSVHNFASCNATHYTLLVFAWISGSSTHGILILRTWAIYGKNLFVLFVIGSVAICLIATQIMVILPGQTPVYDPTPVIGGCLTTPKSWLSRVYATSLFLLSAFSTMVFLLTAFRTLSASRQAKALRVHNSLYSLLFQDGLVHYMAINAISIVGVVFQFNPYLRDTSGSSVSLAASTLSPVIVCWLTLKLRQVGHQRLNEKGLVSVSRGTGTATMPEIAFASGRFLGNIGAPLRSSDDEDEDGDVRGDDMVSDSDSELELEHV